jgi:hypothetical protein
MLTYLPVVFKHIWEKMKRKEKRRDEFGILDISLLLPSAIAFFAKASIPEDKDSNNYTYRS